mmetsp:Transcript_113750/g.178987  ORF Transcript_113750/g.178987 Transcript_113750/m.178987 type:complete len:259 (-) Transcript_113750:79-855(-)
MGSRISHCCKLLSVREHVDTSQDTISQTIPFKDEIASRTIASVNVIVQNMAGNIVFGLSPMSGDASVKEMQVLVARAMHGPSVKLLHMDQLLQPQTCLGSIGLVDGSALTAVLDTPRWKLNLRNASARKADHIVDWLMDKGCVDDVNDVDEAGWNALMFASDLGCERIVDRLLAIGVDVNAKSSSGMTATILAFRGGHCNVAEKLVEAGADVNERTHYACNAAHYAGRHSANPQERDIRAKLQAIILKANSGRQIENA